VELDHWSAVAAYYNLQKKASGCDTDELLDTQLENSVLNSDLEVGTKTQNAKHYSTTFRRFI
jgi:hypothetical protein